MSNCVSEEEEEKEYICVNQPFRTEQEFGDIGKKKENEEKKLVKKKDKCLRKGLWG